MKIITNILLWSMPGSWEWALIIFAIVLLFGGKKIPELMKGIGEGISEFKKGINGRKQENKD